MDSVNSSKKYNERIIWIQANNTNYFTYDITGMIPQDCYDLNVKLTLCYISEIFSVQMHQKNQV